MSSQKYTKESPPKRIRSYMLYAGLGMSLCTEIVVAGLVGWWAGSWADKKWGTSPWIMTGGMVLMIVVSLIHIIMTLQRVQERTDVDD